MKAVKTSLPEKLLGDMRKSSANQREALRSIIDEVMERYPEANVRATKRYSALYKGRSLVVYIDPQHDRILLGFFAYYIEPLSPPPKIHPVPFPTWSYANGGLVGYAIQGFGGDLPRAVADVRRLIHESYRWA